MSERESAEGPAAAEPVKSLGNRRQQVFVRYFTAILIDLVVLNLFAEYWELVRVDAFSTSLIAALLLQILLKLTLAVEHRIGHYFSAKSGGTAKFLRIFSAWLVLFGSKFLMLGILERVFGEALTFSGPVHGVVAFIAVVVAMLVAEQAVVAFFRYLGRPQAEGPVLAPAN